MGGEVSRGKASTKKKGSGNSRRSAGKASSNKAAKAGASAKTSSSGGQGFSKETMLLWVVALVAVISVAGYVAYDIVSSEPTALTPATSNTPAPLTAPDNGSSEATSTTEGQQNPGDLPLGHPAIGDEATETGASQAPPEESQMDNIKSDVPPSGPLQPGGQSVDVKADR